MRAFIEQWVVAPFLVLVATFQLAFAALSQKAMIICTRGCSYGDSNTVTLDENPLLFSLVLLHAFAFLAWAGWIISKYRDGRRAL